MPFQEAYKEWLCSNVVLPEMIEGNKETCKHATCKRVLQRCPYFLPHTDYLWSGQSAFECEHDATGTLNVNELRADFVWVGNLQHWVRADFVWLWKSYCTDVPCPCCVLAFLLDEKCSHAIWLVEKISSMPCRDCAVCHDFSHSYEICSIAWTWHAVTLKRLPIVFLYT
jgi:hypothetical protein